MTKLASAKQSAIPFAIFCSILLLALCAHYSLQSNPAVSKQTPLPQSSSEKPAAASQPVAMNEFKQS